MMPALSVPHAGEGRILNTAWPVKHVVCNGFVDRIFHHHLPAIFPIEQGFVLLRESHKLVGDLCTDDLINLVRFQVMPGPNIQPKEDVCMRETPLLELNYISPRFQLSEDALIAQIFE